MKMWTRKCGSQRTSRMKPIELGPHFAGQNGSLNLEFKTAEGWMVVEFENADDVRALMSAVATIHHNFRKAA